MIDTTLLRRAAPACVFVAFLCQTVLAQDWPQWRGPNRDGVVSSFIAPKAWPEKLKQKWTMSVGLGHASPVVAGQRVFIFSRIDDNEVASCFELETGKLIWRDAYPASYTMNPAAVSHGKGPKSTPVFAGGKLYTFGISGVLSCYDASVGKLLWRKEFAKQYKLTSPLYGTAMSPIVDRGLLIAHVGGNNAGALMAFDADTGALRWSWTGDGPGYASPIAADFDGLRQIVTQTQKYIVGVSASSGALLWQIPFETEYVQNIVTPALYKNTLIISGLDKGTMALNIVKRGSTWVIEQLWRNPDVSMYMSSPVVSGEFVFGLSHKRKGQFFCLNARTGATAWASEGRAGDNAAIAVSDTLLFMLTSEAELIVAKNDSSGYQVFRKYTVADSPTWAHPVIVGNRILIKDATTLAMWSVE